MLSHLSTVYMIIFNNVRGAVKNWRNNSHNHSLFTIRGGGGQSLKLIQFLTGI